MGHNLISGCHKCRVQCFHYRNEENKTILPFYLEHKDCAREDVNNVQTVMDNNNTDMKWQDREDCGGYTEVNSPLS